MNQCSICKVSVHPQHEACPLCGKRLGASGSSATSYPKYAFNEGDAGFTMTRLLFFLMIAACAITVFINIFTFDQKPTPWSAIVVLSFLFLWRIIVIVRTRKANAGRKILGGYAILSAFLIGLDIYSGFLKWSTTYVIPFLTVFVAFVFTVLAMRGKKTLREYMGYLLAVFFISLCPAITFLLSLSTQAWSSLVAILYCFLTVVALIIFMGGNFRGEIKKRFHY